MGTASEEQAIDIECQLMTEIVVYVVALGILYKEVLIAPGHRMGMRNMGKDMQAVSYLARNIYKDYSLLHLLRPLSSNGMQIASLGKEPPADGIGRNKDLRPVVYLQQMLQTSCVVAMAMGDKDIVNGAEVDAQPLGIADKHIGGSRIEQDAILVCL